MLEEKIEKEIFKRIEALNESLKYSIESLCELQSGLQSIAYLLYLSKKL